MKKISLIFLALALAAGMAAERDYKVKESESIQKTLAFKNPEASKKLIVDNLFGSIRVKGAQSKGIQVSIQKTINAKNDESLEKARKEVSLDITEEGNTIELYVDGPFRDKEDNRYNRECRHPGYEVLYDFDIRVPFQIDLCLKTVTDGEISVRAVEGDFDIRHVDGKIVLTDIAGSGSAHTVSGRVEASFAKNPSSDCSFKTIDGDVKLLFQPDLSADFRIKSFTGDAYSDFVVSYLPRKPGTASREKGKYVYRSGMTGIRIGRGGPEIKMDTMTGDILIEKSK